MSQPDDLRERLQGSHTGLPPQLQIINRFVLDRPDQAALMTIAEISEEIGVQPSSVIRFSKAVGYQGFSEIQRILRRGLTSGPRDYFDRLDTGGAQNTDLARFRALAQASLSDLPAEADVTRAAEIMARARIVHVLGYRRAYGIAAYLTYLLSGFGAPVNQLAARGNMSEAMLSVLGPDDVLIAMSFRTTRPRPWTPSRPRRTAAPPMLPSPTAMSARSRPAPRCCCSPTATMMPGSAPARAR